MDGLKIGELAKRTGVTVRALHHYHEVGLLVPSHHTPGEHRVYTDVDLARLQRILSLQALGLSLAEIRAALDDPGSSLLETLERHLARVELELDEGRRLRERLARAAALLRSGREPTTEDWIETIEDTVMYEQHFTPEQREALRERGQQVGPERIAEVQREWQALFDELAAARDAGAAPDSERALGLARRAQALIDEFTGARADMERSVARVYREEGGGPQVMERHGMQVAPGVWEYMSAALAALRAG